MLNAREAALKTLTAVCRRESWLDKTLEKNIREGNLDQRDSSLATALCFGVVQNQILLDWYISQFSNVKMSKMEPEILCDLRLAFYQILFMNRIPDHAVVNEAVNLAHKYGKNPRSAGMVNGILRTLLRNLQDLNPPEGNDWAETMSVLYSHPKWLVRLYEERIGKKDTERLLCFNNSSSPLIAQVNTLRGDADSTAMLLEEQNVKVERHPWLTDCLMLRETGNIQDLEAYKRGLFYIQDAAAKLAVMAADPQPGQKVLDCCAAPGGKSFAAAILMKNQGMIFSCDIYPHKIKLLEEGKKRLGLSMMQTFLQSGTEFREEWEKTFDLVMADVPCSGLGIIRKKPDIRYMDRSQLSALTDLQYCILNTCSEYVKPGGVLLYSTCTLTEQENEEIVRKFLSMHDEFLLSEFFVPEAGHSEGVMTLWPYRYETDGFFIAKMKRRG